MRRRGKTAVMGWSTEAAHVAATHVTATEMSTAKATTHVATAHMTTATHVTTAATAVTVRGQGNGANSETGQGPI
jgi:hypothetical protein